MGELWIFHRFRLWMALFLAICWLNQNLDSCWCLNAEGSALLRFGEGVVRDPYGALLDWNDDGLNDPCSWYGVDCSDGNVVSLNLKGLCLGGTLAPELGTLNHIKSINLRNNSFYGIIPKEIGELKELEELDLGYNNFSGPLPSDLGNNLPLAILLLDNNKFLGGISPKVHELSLLSEAQVDENQLTNAVQATTCNIKSIPWNFEEAGYKPDRKLLGAPNPSSSGTKSPSPFPSPTPFPSSQPPSPSSASPVSSPAPTPDPASPTPTYQPIIAPVPAPVQSPSASPANTSSPSPTSKKIIIILSAFFGALFLLFISLIGIFFCQSNKKVTVEPWSTGLSGQLQKAFVTGVPKLKHSELETACEDFSNIIDSSSDGTVYKGTLSSGVEIAVTSTAVTAAKDWSKNFEEQFRKKIETLSKVNHKNLVNLIGYCEEEEPFTRMMVFEYAPNGTLFEHLHIKEAEHLDWGARLRIAMGMAYCLEHMHELNPPVIHKNMHSSIIYLSEDYAAKISDFNFLNEVAASKIGSDGMEHLKTPSPESNIYSFGVILLEMITGRLPYPLVDWALVYLRGDQPFKDMVDPTLESFQEDELGKLCEVIRSCIHPDPKQRPMMREVAARLREITAMEPHGVTPKVSPLWWAELEIQSTEAS